MLDLLFTSILAASLGSFIATDIWILLLIHIFGPTGADIILGDNNPLHHRIIGVIGGCLVALISTQFLRISIMTEMNPMALAVIGGFVGSIVVLDLFFAITVPSAIRQQSIDKSH